MNLNPKQWIRRAIYGVSDAVVGGRDGRMELLPEERDQRDAYMHADASASMVFRFSRVFGGDVSQWIAGRFGALKEGLGSWGNAVASDADARKDLYNNEIGRQIGEYAAENNLSERELHKLVRDAYDRGELVRLETDVRLDTQMDERGRVYAQWTPPVARTREDERTVAMA